jgi:hypothetical protein
MATRKKSTGKKSSAKARAKVGKVMHEYKHGELKSGGRKKVKSRKQAIAIGLSEARRSGANVPPPKKKSTSKKSSSKKSSSRKGSSKKSSKKS